MKKRMSLDLSKFTSEQVLSFVINAWKSSREQGLSYLGRKSEEETKKDVISLLDKGNNYFEYLNGKVMKLDLSDLSKVDTWGYNRDNGSGALEKVYFLCQV